MITEIINGCGCCGESVDTFSALNFEYLGTNGGRVFLHTDSNYHYNWSGNQSNNKFFDELLKKISNNTMIGSFQPLQNDAFSFPLDAVDYNISISNIYNYNTIIVGHKQNACSSNEEYTYPKNLLSYVDIFKNYVLDGNNLFVMGEHSRCQDLIINQFLGAIGCSMYQNKLVAEGGFEYLYVTAEGGYFGFPLKISSALVSRIYNGIPLYRLGNIQIPTTTTTTTSL